MTTGAFLSAILVLVGYLTVFRKAERFRQEELQCPPGGPQGKLGA